LQVDLADKKRAAAVVCGVRTTTADGAPVAYSEFTTFALGAGASLAAITSACRCPAALESRPGIRPSPPFSPRWHDSLSLHRS